VSSADKGGSSDATSALFSRKSSRFFEIYGVRTDWEGGGELIQCGHFADKEGGSIFCDFERMSFMDVSGCHLWTVPKFNYLSRK